MPWRRVTLRFVSADPRNARARPRVRCRHATRSRGNAADLRLCVSEARGVAGGARHRPGDDARGGEVPGTGAGRGVFPSGGDEAVHAWARGALRPGRSQRVDLRRRTTDRAFRRPTRCRRPLQRTGAAAGVGGARARAPGDGELRGVRWQAGACVARRKGRDLQGTFGGDRARDSRRGVARARGSASGVATTAGRGGLRDRSERVSVGTDVATTARGMSALPRRHLERPARVATAGRRAGHRGRSSRGARRWRDLRVFARGGGCAVTVDHVAQGMPGSRRSTVAARARGGEGSEPPQ